MPQDANHLASEIWSNRYIAAGGLIVVPEFMLVELAATLARQTQQPDVAKQRAKDLYGTVLSIHTVDTTLIQLAIDTAADLRLKAGDAVYVALAHQLGIPLISWDKEQLARAAPLVEAYSPDLYPF